MPSKPLKAIKPMFQRDKWKIVRGDLVHIIAGKDKGKQGKVLRVIRDTRFPRVVVEGLNLVKRHVPRQEDSPGFVVTMEAPVHYSNVMLVDPMTSKPCRVQWFWERQPNGSVEKVRRTKGRNASGSILPKPQAWKDTLPSFDPSVGVKDTPPEVAAQISYLGPDLDFIPGKLPASSLTKALAKSGGGTANFGAAGAAAAAGRRSYGSWGGAMPPSFAASALLAPVATCGGGYVGSWARRRPARAGGDAPGGCMDAGTGGCSSSDGEGEGGSLRLAASREVLGRGAGWLRQWGALRQAALQQLLGSCEPGAGTGRGGSSSQLTPWGRQERAADVRSPGFRASEAAAQRPAVASGAAACDATDALQQLRL